MTADPRLALLDLIEERERRRKFNALRLIFPDTGPYRRELYKKHLEFFELGLTKRIRGFIAANQVGKSTAGCVEMVYHMTGLYPDWWKGRCFDRPTRWWAASNTQLTTRDNLQRKLLGVEHGTGFIPRDLFTHIAKKHAPADAVDFVKVRHVSGGESVLTFKSYDQGREKFQAEPMDGILLDEEPKDYGIYSECVTRTAATDGMVMLTFTALFGITMLVCKFMPQFAAVDLENIEEDVDDSSRAAVVCGWDDVPHLGEKARKELKAEYPPHELQARTQGIPSVGIGQIYPIPEKEFVIPPFALPDYWPRVAALDPGIKRTAGLWAAIDQQTDTAYLYSEHYRTYAEVEVHAAAFKARGVRIPIVSDNAYDVASGKTIIDQYREQGLRVRPAQKSDKDGRIALTFSRLSTGRMKVFSTLHNWLFEFRMYRTDESGRIASEHDHLMNCTEYISQSGIKIAEPLGRPSESVSRTEEQTFGIYG
jgi:phage terminase large subunit-like protein